MLAAWVCNVAFTVHSVAGSLNPGIVSAASTNTYKLGFLLSFLIGGLVYYVPSLIRPSKILSGDVDKNGKPGFEELAGNEGFFEHESVVTITGVLCGESSETASQAICVVESKIDEK